MPCCAVLCRAALRLLCCVVLCCWLTHVLPNVIDVDIHGQLFVATDTERSNHLHLLLGALRRRKNKNTGEKPQDNTEKTTNRLAITAWDLKSQPICIHRHGYMNCRMYNRHYEYTHLATRLHPATPAPRGTSTATATRHPLLRIHPLSRVQPSP